LRSIRTFLCLIAVASSLCAQHSPKAIEGDLIGRVSAIDVEALPQLTADKIAPYETASDGTRFTIFRIRKTGAESILIRFEDVRLPQGGSLLVYGSDASKSWTFNGELDPVAVVRGDTATIEIQCTDECTPDLPFTISEISATTAPENIEAAINTDLRSGHFRGVDLEYEVRDGLAVFEGDMVLGQVDEIEPPRGVSRKGNRDAIAISGQSYRWPGGRIPYVIASTVSDPQRVLNAISHWNTTMAGVIRLVPHTSESVYVNFIRSNACSSNVGMYTTGNYVFVGDSCSVGSIIHEIGHIVGLWHEQSREDRNSHVKILWDNILSSAVGNFGQQIAYGDDIGVYDFNSIMHYPAYAFSSNGKNTIETIPAGIPIGQRAGLSTGDIAAVRKMYGYSTSTSTGTTTPTAPSTVTVTIAANPTTEKVIVDGVTYTGSRTFQWTVGSAHAISASPLPEANGRRSTFVKWSDGGGQSHTIVASSSIPLYRADFALAYTVSAAVYPAQTGLVSVAPASSNGYFPNNSTVSLDAAAVTGYCFRGWSGLIAGTPSHAEISVTKPYAVTANFQTGSFTVSQVIAYAAAGGGSATVGLTGSTGCLWTAKSYSSWITVSAPASGVGSGVIRYNVAPNSSPLARSGFLIVAGKPIFISQSGSY
jgi:hypothetical protein